MSPTPRWPEQRQHSVHPFLKLDAKFQNRQQLVRLNRSERHRQQRQAVLVQEAYLSLSRRYVGTFTQVCESSDCNYKRTQWFLPFSTFAMSNRKIVPRKLMLTLLIQEAILECLLNQRGRDGETA